MEPAAFAAELIARLEKLKLELETRHSLEERLQQIQEVGAALTPRPRLAGEGAPAYPGDPQPTLPSLPGRGEGECGAGTGLTRGRACATPALPPAIQQLRGGPADHPGRPPVHPTCWSLRSPGLSTEPAAPDLWAAAASTMCRSHVPG